MRMSHSGSQGYQVGRVHPDLITAIGIVVLISCHPAHIPGNLPYPDLVPGLLNIHHSVPVGVHSHLSVAINILKHKTVIPCPEVIPGIGPVNLFLNKGISLGEDGGRIQPGIRMPVAVHIVIRTALHVASSKQIHKFSSRCFQDGDIDGMIHPVEGNIFRDILGINHIFCRCPLLVFHDHEYLERLVFESQEILPVHIGIGKDPC